MLGALIGVLEDGASRVRGSSLPTATSSGSNSARLATRSSAGDSVMAVSYPAGFYPVPNGSLLRPRGTSAVARSCRGQVNATADVSAIARVLDQARPGVGRKAMKHVADERATGVRAGMSGPFG